MRLLIVFFVGLALAGCTREEMKSDWKEPLKTAPAPKEEVHQAVSQSSSVQRPVFQFANWSFMLPIGLKQAPSTSSMRLAEFRFDKQPELELTAFHFGPSAGSIEANLSRWKGQFVEMTSDREQDIHSGRVRLVDYRGSFKLAARPMAAEFEKKDGYRMLAAIVDTTMGPLFFKLTGPEDQVSTIESMWLELFQGASSQ